MWGYLILVIENSPASGLCPRPHCHCTPYILFFRKIHIAQSYILNLIVLIVFHQYLPLPLAEKIVPAPITEWTAGMSLHSTYTKWSRDVYITWAISYQTAAVRGGSLARRCPSWSDGRCHSAASTDVVRPPCWAPAVTAVVWWRGEVVWLEQPAECWCGGADRTARSRPVIRWLPRWLNRRCLMTDRNLAVDYRNWTYLATQRTVN